MDSYNIPLKYIKGVGEKRAETLNKLGISDLSDLIRYFPRSYLDFSSVTAIKDMIPDNTYCFKAVVAFKPIRANIRKGMTIFKTVATDGGGVIHIIIFNSQYLADSLKEEEEYFFLGKVTENHGELEINNPLVEKGDSEVTFKPIYSLTSGINSSTIARIIGNALKIYREQNIPDMIPDYIRQQFGLCHEQYALENIHFPKSAKDLEIAKTRLIFEEMLVLQMGMRMLKNGDRGKTNAIIEKDYTDEFCRILPFQLTNAQKRVITESITDMKKDKPMNRLIQGDVGSGKTAVAACLIYSAAKNHIQSAFMAPTEILATQHFETLKKLFSDCNLNFELLTGSTSAKKKKLIKEMLKKGELDFIIGTHALLSDDIEFFNLGLVVTDEQHRFGVNQRGTLTFKGNNPHTLVMSATPIPRTLSLIIYGDLDLSVIDELPVGRQHISTYCVDTSYRKRIYAFVKKHLDKGLQAYIVCPLVEESESDMVSATEYAESLRNNEFSAYNVGLLHGKMKAKEKDKIMTAFAKGEINLLVSTTVIEVGVDVPNSVIMVVENAERFGLSQLHQLRGRVGRGKEKSYCILISDNMNEKTKSRLDVMCKTDDGFKIADEDLKLRGPGDFFGKRQHGLPELKIADLMENMDALKKAGDASKIILKKDRYLTLPENKALSNAVERLFNKDDTLSFN